MHLSLEFHHPTFTSSEVIVLTNRYTDAADNAISAKIGRVASKEVTLQLIKVKCLPVLLYGLEACPLTKSDLQSLDFVINSVFIKLFTTKSIEIVKYCQEYFGFALPSALLWAKRVAEFEFSFKSFLSAP